MRLTPSRQGKVLKGKCKASADKQNLKDSTKRETSIVIGAASAELGTSPHPGSGEKPEELFYMLLSLILDDVAQRLGVESSTFDKDRQTLKRRISGNGMQFLTKELPILGKALDKCLSQDSPFSQVPSFEKSKRGNWPVFLGPLWERILDPDGRIIDTAGENWPVEKSPDWYAQLTSVRAVRQICYMAYKLEGCCSEESNQAVLNNFVEVEKELPDPDEKRVFDYSVECILDSARILLFKVLRKLDPKDILPKHGPGSVATRELPWEKMDFSRFYPELDSEYPYSEYFHYSYGHLCDNLEDYLSMNEETQACARVCLVPKDSRGPRIISMEPLEYQWIQQGLQTLIYNHVERHPLTHGFVNFTDQEINRNLALEHSENGDYVTLDLKDASDRVSLWLVRRLFPQPLLKHLEAARSQFTQLPGGLQIRLKKFAPMGSAVCFPVEALTFWALSVAVIRPTLERHFKEVPEVYVYGDDLIVPKGTEDAVRELFAKVHLVLNEDKCCVGKWFRESCGKDAFRRSSVEPARVKKHFPNSRKSCDSSPDVVLHWIAFANALQHRGYWSAARYVRNRLSAIHLHEIPYSKNPHSMGAFIVDDLTESEIKFYLRKHFKVRYNKALQKLQIRVPLVQPKRIKRSEEGWKSLLRLKVRTGPPDPWGLKTSNTVQASPDIFELPHRLKWGWSWQDLQSYLEGDVDIY